MLNLYLMMLDGPGEEEIFRDVYYRYRNLMYYIAYDILHNIEDAEDAVQDAFLKIAMNFPQPSLDDPTSKHARNLCAMIAKYQAIDHYRRRKKRQENEITTDSFDIDEMLLQEPEGPDSVTRKNFAGWANQDYYFEEDRPYEKILKIIEEMPEKYTDVLYLYLVQGKKRREIAYDLSLSLGTVKKRLERGKALLKEKIQESEGVDLNE